MTSNTADFPTTEDFRALHEHRNGPCVSLYMPTHRSGPQTEQDPIRLKNLLREAERELGLDEAERLSDSDSLLEPGWELVDDHDFWQHQTGGLALFFAPDLCHSFRVAVELPEVVWVRDRFQLTPLLPAYPAVDERYHVLALSQDDVRLLVGDRFRLREIEAGEIPQDLRDVVGYDHEQKALQFHTGVAGGSAPGGGRRAAMFHGHGAGDDDAEKELQQFLYRVDDGLIRLIGTPRPPLVIAAVERVGAEYRDLSKHDRIVQEIAHGNPEHLSADDLHRKTWPLVRELFQAPCSAARRSYEELQHTDRTSDELADIVAASDAGRVEALLVATGATRWGTFDSETHEVDVQESPSNGSVELVGLAAMEALAHGGRVFVVDPDEVPGRGPAAALFRY